MRTTIYKYPLTNNGGDLQKLELPSGAKILHFGLQDNKLYIWAKVVLDFTKELRFFRVVGTGCELGINSGEYIGTIFQGPYVWHLFEVQNPGE